MNTLKEMILGSPPEQKTQCDSAFEIAVIAALLAVREKSACDTPAENYIPAADRLLKAATRYLKQPSEAEQRKWFLHMLNMFPFDEVLKPIEPAGEGRKKPRTMVGGITTVAGLKKAIARIFPQAAKEIIKLGKLNQMEIDAMLASQGLANKAKTQAAKKARKKPVK